MCRTCRETSLRCIAVPAPLFLIPRNLCNVKRNARPLELAFLFTNIENRVYSERSAYMHCSRSGDLFYVGSSNMKFSCQFRQVTLFNKEIKPVRAWASRARTEAYLLKKSLFFFLKIFKRCRQHQFDSVQLVYFTCARIEVDCDDI